MTKSFKELTDMKTLLIDDDQLIRNSFGMAFKAKGCYLRAVETAEEGLRALEEESFDLIICDYRLPGLDGLEFFKIASSSHPKSFNILITAYGADEIASQALRIGVHDIIQKPFSPERIMESAAPLLEKQKEGGQ